MGAYLIKFAEIGSLDDSLPQVYIMSARKGISLGLVLTM